MLIYCWPRVGDDGPTLNQHWFCVSCWPGHHVPSTCHPKPPHASKHESFSQGCFNVGPTSKTMANNKTTLGSSPQFCDSVVDGCQILMQDWFLSSPVSEYCFKSLSAKSWQYRDKRKPEIGTMPYFFWMTSMVFYSAQYHREHCKLQAFEQFGTLYTF